MLNRTWMRELIAAPGGAKLGMTAEERAPILDLAALERLESEVVVKPCGYSVERTPAELELLPSVLPWARWSAVRAGQVYVSDANAFFSPASLTRPSSWPLVCTRRFLGHWACYR